MLDGAFLEERELAARGYEPDTIDPGQHHRRAERFCARLGLHPVVAVVRGRDLDGHALRIPRDYLTRGLRQRSQELATQRLGLRSDREILAAHELVAERTQFTELDRMLLRRADARGIVSYREPVPPLGTSARALHP